MRDESRGFFTDHSVIRELKIISVDLIRAKRSFASKSIIFDTKNEIECNFYQKSQIWSKL